MEKINKFINDYDCSHYQGLPKFMKRRVNALKKIQLEHIKIQHMYHQEFQALEMKYEKLFKPLYEQRAKIVTGETEPTDEDCELPATIVENGDEEDVENDEFSPLLTEEEEKALKTEVKGLPGFWLGCLVSTYNFSDSIEDHDRPILKHLSDLRIVYGQSGENLTYTIEFVFDENSYFTNKVLTKTYYLKSKPDDKDPFSYEGFEICKSEGCDINWNPGKNVTTKTVTVKQQNKTDGRTREKKKEVEQDSFFCFFKPPAMPDNADDEIDVELGAVMAVDFELGEVIRQQVIPKAPLYYNGYLMSEDDISDDEDDDDDSDSVDDDDDDDDDGSDQCY